MTAAKQLKKTCKSLDLMYDAEIGGVAIDADDESHMLRFRKKTQFLIIISTGSVFGAVLQFDDVSKAQRSSTAELKRLYATTESASCKVLKLIRPAFYI